MCFLQFVFVTWTLIGGVCYSSVLHLGHHGCFSTPSTTVHRLRHGHLLYPFVPTNCLQLCSGKGYYQAGLHSRNSMCYCSNELSRLSKAEDSQCSPCEDDSSLLCGGDDSISVYNVDYTASVVEKRLEMDRAFDEEEPMVLFATHEAIYLYNTTNHSLRALVEVSSPVHALDYSLFNQLGFAISGGVLFRFPLFSGSVQKDSDMEVMYSLSDIASRRCLTFAVDWVHEKIYLPDCYYHSIMSVGMDNSSLYFDVNTVLTLNREGAWAMDMAVDPYKGLLFWTSGATLWSCRLDGKALRQVVPEFPVNRVSSLALDLDEDRVYFTGLDKHDKNSSRLYFAGYQGALSHSLQYSEYEGGTRVLSFGIYNHHIYFVKRVGANSTVVMASKLDYSHSPSILIQGNVTVELIKLVHPGLQSTSRQDACTHHGCSHVCAVEAGLPHCYCPRDHLLELDNKTCVFWVDEKEDAPLLIQGIEAAIPVLLVLLGAGVLMCLCDKLWSQLHPSVVRLSTGPLGARGLQDRQNLI